MWCRWFKVHSKDVSGWTQMYCPNAENRSGDSKVSWLVSGHSSMVLTKIIKTLNKVIESSRQKHCGTRHRLQHGSPYIALNQEAPNVLVTTILAVLRSGKSDGKSAQFVAWRWVTSCHPSQRHTSEGHTVQTWGGSCVSLAPDCTTGSKWDPTNMI